MTEPVRLAKRLAQILSCSRREAELYIEGGWVLVDGVTVEEPQFKVAQQQIELRPGAVAAPIAPATFLLNLAAGAETKIDSARQLFTADSRSSDDHSGIPLLRQQFSQLLECAPLQGGATGLAVFTQDWKVKRKLIDEAATVEQEYIVEVAGAIAEATLKHLNGAITMDGDPIPAAKVSRQSETRLRFAIKGVLPGQIAHLCGSAALQPLSMKRIRIGRVSMGKLPSGCWRHLTQHERF